MSLKPRFIVYGEHDELISFKLVCQFRVQLRGLIEIDRVNHLFNGQSSELSNARADLI